MEEQVYKSILISKGTNRFKRLVSYFTKLGFFLVTSVSILAVFLIILFVAKDAIPYFKIRGISEFFTSIKWYPASDQPEFGVLPIIFGSILVTVLSTLISVPLALFSAFTLSDILPFSARQIVKPIIEIIAAIPSVAYGFFALVIFAPFLQKNGGHLLGITVWMIGVPVLGVLTIIIGQSIVNIFFSKRSKWFGILTYSILIMSTLFILCELFLVVSKIKVESGTNAFNVSVILAIMALPTIVSVSEDALFSAGREIREGSYALGATRAETLLKIVVPAVKSGILAAVILGIMRALGETMVVWMASGNAAQIPEPWFNIMEPIRTLTATIAGDMGEADHVTGSARYHVLFAMALFLLIFSFIGNLVSEWIISNQKKKRSR